MINKSNIIDLNKNSITIINNLFTNLYCAQFSGIVISICSTWVHSRLLRRTNLIIIIIIIISGNFISSYI